MNPTLNVRRYLPKGLALILLFFCWSMNAGAQLASWTAATLNTNPTSGTLSATSLATNVSVGALSRSGLTAGAGNARYNSQGWNSSSNYLLITVTAATGYTMNLSGKTFVFNCGSSNTGPSAVKLYSSVDNYAASLGTINSSSGTSNNTITLPSTAAYASLSTISFRVRNDGALAVNGSAVGAQGTFGPVLLTVNGTINIVAPTVTTTRATVVTATGITSGGNVTSNGGATLTARGVAWGTAVNPTTAVTTAGTATGTYTTQVTTMLPNKDYYYRAFATNSTGTSYGVNYDTTTLAEVPDIIAVNNTLNPATELDILVAENDNPDGSPATEHTTQYAISETTTGKWVQANGTLGTTVAWMAHAAIPETITGLNPLTQYCFKAKARNADNKETALSSQDCISTQGAAGNISDVADNTIADFCAGANNTFTLNYTSTLSSGTYTAQMSNASGSFTAPVSIGNSSSATAMQVTIPVATVAGTGYKIRVINGTKISDTTAAFTVKAIPTGALTTSTPVICPGQEATAKLTFNADENSVGPFQLSIKNVAGDVTAQYTGIVSGNAFDVDNTQLPADGSNQYQLLQITAANGCSNE